MSWGFFLSIGLALVYLAWIWRDRKAYNRARLIFCLIGSAGILITLACDFIRTLPSHAPQHTIAGFVTYRSSLMFDLFDRRNSDFILVEKGTGRRILFTTDIDGPWAHQPVRVTYVADGRYMPSVVRIEILSDPFSWHVRKGLAKGLAGWVGTAEAKRSTPLVINFLGFVFILAGVFAPGCRKENTQGQTDDQDIGQPTTPGG